MHNSHPTAVPASVDVYSLSYKRYATILLLLIYIFNRADATIFVLLMEPIKQEFDLSDAGMGFLAGPAMVLVYALLGVPVARWADRSHRVNIMSGAIVFWSVIVMLTATAGKFWHLVLARIGVGVGEAGFTAVAQSVIADYHTPAERTRAMSIFMLGLPLGVFVTYLIGGWVNEIWGWRTAFLLAGAPGLVLAVMLKWTVAEPPRGFLSPATVQQPTPPLRSVLATLWRRRALRHLTAALTLFYFMSGALGTWTVPFFIRTHGMSTGELGTWLAFTGGLGGIVGVWLSGRVFTWFNIEDPRAQLRLVALLAAVAWFSQMGILLWPTKTGALLLVAAHNVLTQFFFAPSYALMQSLCAPRMRATMISISVLAQSLAGSIIGTQLMGLMSDALAPRFADQALRLGMLALTPMFLWIACHFWLAGRSVRQDLAAVSP